MAQGPIISIGGDVTEIVYALGAGDRVIAVDITSRHPRAARDLPQVGYMRQLSAEPILSLSPSLILAIADSGPPQVLDQLRAAGTCLVLVPDEHSPDGVIKKVEAVAAALDRKAQGDALATRLKAEFAALQSSLDAVKDKPRVLFLFSVGEGAPMVGGLHSSADAIIQLAGGRNAIEGFDNFKPASSEGIIAAAPDVVLVTDLTIEKLGGVEGLLQRPDIAQTPAGKARRVVAMDSLLLLGFGPRTPQAIRELATALHPGFVLPPDPAN
jgi:iron complex transport system substrate-binding protein